MSLNRKTFFLATLGCKVNQYESQSLREAWAARGLEEAECAAGARTVVVNTCAVTAKAVADGRAAVRRAHRENPDAEIVVTGCAAQVLAKEFETLPGVTLVVPQENKEKLLRYADITHDGPAGKGLPEEDSAHSGAAPEYPAFAITEYDRSRAVLKVQDGCSHRCTYCIVPLTRGTSRSRLPEETLAEAKRLLDAGFRELVLNGINLFQYGRDLADPHDFWDLVAYLDTNLAPEWAGRARIRLSSLEPGQLGTKALDVMGESSLVAPHLHLSLQSGSNAVLRRMGRGHYDPGILDGFCRDLSGIFPLFGLGADILSGFPGETDAHAAETEALCGTLPFSYAHVFPYSKRPGTPAATFADQVVSAIKKDRAARLRAIFTAKKKAFLERCLTLPEMRVACEPFQEGPGQDARQDGREKTGGISGGVNEFYADCRFVEGGGPQNAFSRALVAAKPVRTDGALLWVEALEKGE